MNRLPLSVTTKALSTWSSSSLSESSMSNSSARNTKALPLWISFPLNTPQTSTQFKLTRRRRRRRTTKKLKERMNVPLRYWFIERWRTLGGRRSISGELSLQSVEFRNKIVEGPIRFGFSGNAIDSLRRTTKIQFDSSPTESIEIDLSKPSNVEKLLRQRNLHCSMLWGWPKAEGLRLWELQLDVINDVAFELCSLHPRTPNPFLLSLYSSLFSLRLHFFLKRLFFLNPILNFFYWTILKIILY